MASQKGQLLQSEPCYKMYYLLLGFGEDLSFCIRAQELGRKIYCDSRIKMGHVGLRVFEEGDLP